MALFYIQVTVLYNLLPIALAVLGENTFSDFSDFGESLFGENERSLFRKPSRGSNRGRDGASRSDFFGGGFRLISRDNRPSLRFSDSSLFGFHGRNRSQNRNKQGSPNRTTTRRVVKSSSTTTASIQKTSFSTLQTQSPTTKSSTTATTPEIPNTVAPSTVVTSTSIPSNSTPSRSTPSNLTTSSPAVNVVTQNISSSITSSVPQLIDDHEARSGRIGLQQRFRNALQQSTVNAASQSIKQLIDANPDEDGGLPFNAGLIRLAFHDCVGVNGCDGCINHFNPANDGLLKYTAKLDRLYRDQWAELFSRADFYALAGIVGLQYAAELTNCTSERCIPQVTYRYGRYDCVNPFIHNNFCPLHTNAEQFFRTEFNLENDLMVAAMGAHTIGKVHKPDGDAWDRTHNQFDNGYFKELLNRENQWKLANRQNTLIGSWITNHDDLIMLGSDIWLIADISNQTVCNPDPHKCPSRLSKESVKAYAHNNQKFLDDFGKAFQRIIDKNPGKPLFLPTSG